MSGKQHAYTTFQPGVQFGRSDYREWNPGNDHIGLMYQFKTDSQTEQQILIVPDACFDLLICCDSGHPSVVIWTSPAVCSVKNQPNFVADAEYFCVRFLPEQYLLPLNESMKTLNDIQVPLKDVIKLENEAYLIESIANARRFEDRIRIFQSYMKVYTETAERQREVKALVNYIIREIYRSKGKVRVSRLAEQTGYSERYIRKKFEEQVGFSPKLFEQIVRFQGAIHEVVLDKQDLTEVAYNNGYHDQAHLIKEFKKFTNHTPSHYRTALNRMQLSV